MSLDYSAMADVSVGKCAAQSAVQLRMHRHKPCLAALARTHSAASGVAVSSDRSRTSRSSASETRRPARHCSSISSFAFGLGRCSDDGVYLVGFKVFRYALLALGSCAVLCFGVTPSGSALAGDCGGRFSGQSRDSYADLVVQYLLRYMFAKLR